MSRAPSTVGTDRSMPRAALTAGIGLLLMAVTAPIGLLAITGSMLTLTDAVGTDTDVAGSAGWFRLGVVLLVAVVALDVVVAWALYRVFAPVHRALSRLAAWFRLAYAVVFLTAVASLPSMLHLLTDGKLGAVMGADRVRAAALLDAAEFRDVWQAGMVLFAIHLLIVGWLAFRSGYMPRLLGILVALSGIGYGFDSVVTITDLDGAPTLTVFTFVGELALGLWLVVRARRLGGPPRPPPPSSSPVRRRTRGSMEA